MKSLVLAALLSCALGANMVIPRLPLSVLLRGNVHLVPEDRIVGGSEVRPNSLPFQVSMQRSSSSGYSVYCGGSIYNENWIICAAHCVSGANPSNFRIVAGEHSISQNEGTEQIRGISRFVSHPQYSSRTYENDISLIRLDAPLDLSVREVASIALPSSFEEVPAGTRLTVSGWGTTSSGGSVSDVLRSVDVPYVDDATCDGANGAGSVYPSMICAGDLDNGGVDSCQGDSGGPLFTSGGAPKLVGIVSWGYGCAVAGKPGVYTQTSYFIDWITTNAN